MSLANRLSSKFHSYPRSFASRQTVYFSDNLLDTDIISSDIPADGRGLFTKYIKQLYINILYVWKWIKTSLGTCSCRYFAAPPISNEHSVIWFCLWQLSILYIFMGGRGWRSWNISPFQPQGPQFNSRICQDLNIARLSFPPKLTQLSILPV